MSWSQMDKRLAEYSDALLEMGIHPRDLDKLATRIRDELLSLDSQILKDKFSASYPSALSVNDQIVYNLTFSEKYFSLIYSDDSVNQTAVISANYLYFVYTQDSYLKAILTSAPKGGPSKVVAKFLTSGEVWRFRNAFAHGQWQYTGEGTLKDIEYRVGGRPSGQLATITPQKLLFWHMLSKTILGLWTARLADLRQPLHGGITP